jgi:large subunit ribosomal protein L21
VFSFFFLLSFICSPLFGICDSLPTLFEKEVVVKGTSRKGKQREKNPRLRPFFFSLSSSAPSHSRRGRKSRKERDKKKKKKTFPLKQEQTKRRMKSLFSVLSRFNLSQNSSGIRRVYSSPSSGGLISSLLHHQSTSVLFSSSKGTTLQWRCGLSTTATAATTVTNETKVKRPSTRELVKPTLLATEKRENSLDGAFAVVHLSGHQYKITNGDVIISEKLLGPEVGDEIYLLKVLLIGTKDWTAIGTPLLESAKVRAVVEEQTKADKVIIFKKKRRKNYRRHKGHRQPITTLRITDIIFDTTKGNQIPNQAKEGTSETK